MRVSAPIRQLLTRIGVVVGVLVVTGGLQVAAGHAPSAEAHVTTPSVIGSDGRTCLATNHLIPMPEHDKPRDWPLAWSGDASGSVPGEAPGPARPHGVLFAVAEADLR